MKRRKRRLAALGLLFCLYAVPTPDVLASPLQAEKAEGVTIRILTEVEEEAVPLADVPMRSDYESVLQTVFPLIVVFVLFYTGSVLNGHRRIRELERELVSCRGTDGLEEMAEEEPEYAARFLPPRCRQRRREEWLRGRLLDCYLRETFAEQEMADRTE